MAAHHYERLTQFDNTFLVFEDPCAHMHVGSTQIFDAGPLHTPGGGVDVENIRDYVVSRLHRIPRYRQRLAWTPLASHPGLGGRRSVQHLLPRAPHAPPGAGRRATAEAGRRPHHVAAARPAQTALGDVGHRGARRRTVRDGHQDAPLHDRRHLGRRPDLDAAHHRAGAARRSAAPVGSPPRARKGRALARRGAAASRRAARGCRISLERRPRRRPRTRATGRATSRHGGSDPQGGHERVEHPAQSADRGILALRLAAART